MRSWNLTGLYKRSKDRPMRKSRSRKLQSATPKAQIVIPEKAPLCERCGFATDTNAHRMYCKPSAKGERC
jgi:hypothetical protein